MFVYVYEYDIVFDFWFLVRIRGILKLKIGIKYLDVWLIWIVKIMSGVYLEYVNMLKKVCFFRLGFGLKNELKKDIWKMVRVFL